ncbi:MAG TPA: enoyl-CoA hydratase-related protein [Candidatus Binataceae bacterium]|nr:enoyl-CoA hydratase-related protein [Candidatus Binataceae bacterium]
MGSSYQTIIFEKAGPIARLTMNRPDRLNGMTNRMLLETGDALAGAAEDRELRVLILTGAGKGFCPGADLNRVASGEPDTPLQPGDFRVPVQLHNLHAVTIAAINGACAGAGLGWALACDLRFAAASAKFNVAFLDVGVAGDMGGPWTLAKIVGPGKARELYFFPDKFDAAEAQRIGMVSGVFPDDRLRGEVDAIAERLAGAAPVALSTLKANFVDAERMDFAGYFALESERHLRMFQTADTREAFAAKVEKRKPRFIGR